MEFMEIIIPVLVLFAIAVVCAIILTVASSLFAVKSDEKLVAIRDALPGANCGACGYSGCDGYAKALANGECDKCNLCIPGGDRTAKEIGGVLGLEAGDVVEKVAYVACNGTCGAVEKKHDYKGHKLCHMAKMNYSGEKVCPSACFGYGDCARVCPKDAITIENEVARIDPQKCVGCGICVRECPNSIIKLVNDTTKVVVQCSNHEKGALTRKACKNGCIACGKCVKTCQFDAISVIDNLAVIDYEKCTGCGACTKVCPVGCLHEDNFICGAH